jgi:hypothetical protein
VLQIAKQTAELAIDQGMKDSIRLQEDLALKCPKGFTCEPTKRLFETYYAAAAHAAKVCKPELEKCSANRSPTSDDMFCNPFMKCLAKQGETDGKCSARCGKWLKFDDLCLGSDPKCEIKDPKCEIKDPECEIKDPECKLPQ